MMILIQFSLLFCWITQECVSCVHMNIPTEFLTVALGDSLLLNCTYNCSTGFVRGCWSKVPDNSGCHGIIRTSTFCTVSLHLPNVSMDDLNKNYTCYTQNTEDFQLLQKMERIVLLQLPAQTYAPNFTETPMTKTKSAPFPMEPKDASEGDIPLKVTAVTFVVASVLAALVTCLCLSRNRQTCSCKGERVVSTPGSPLTSHITYSPVKGERVTLRIPTPESDTEVPYADIMITVRGISTPELTQVGYVISGDQKEWWGDESRCHPLASRSADRLHVLQPREISRKMSTNSEYAVITYA